MDGVSGGGDADTAALAEPYSIITIKSKPRVLYPIVYEQSVNNNPYELYFAVDTFANGLFGHRCEDSFDSDANCGFALDRDGFKIPDSQVGRGLNRILHGQSLLVLLMANFKHMLRRACTLPVQGFCCSCSIASQLGTASGPTRASLNCALFGSGQASAHCLRTTRFVAA